MNKIYLRKFINNLLAMSLLLILLSSSSYAITISPKPGEEKISLPESDQTITAIEVVGNKSITEQEILESVFSRIGDVLIKEKVDNDLKAIYSTGFFQDASVSFKSYRNGTKVIFKIKENSHVKKIIIEGNYIISTEAIIALMETKEGKILNYKILQEDIQEINEYYHEKRYILARIVDVTTDPDTNELKLQLIEGIIESIEIEGNTSTKDYVILREMDMRAGDVLNEEQLAKDLRRVFNLGFFSEVTPNFEPGSARDKIILVINIKEGRTNTINFGGGYGEREGWFGFSDLNINNLMGTGHGMMIRGQWGKINTYQFKYYYPWFAPDTFGPRTAMTYRVWNIAGPDIYGNEIRDALRIGWDLKFSRPFREYFSHSVLFGSETVTSRDTDLEDMATFESYASDFIGYTLAYDTRDFWLNPKEGKYYSASIKKGWKITSAITSYTKLGLDLNDYYPLASNQVFATHLGAGIGIGDVPIGELYWCGGANTVRGYYPVDAVTGVRKLILNSEYRYFFNDIFQGVLFYDVGDAWGTVNAPGGGPDMSQFLSGWGFGMRLNTPLGPIRLDYGIAGSRSFGEGIVHFSIGQAF